MLHFIRAFSSFSTLPEWMRMAVRQGKHGAHLSALLKAASGDGGAARGRESDFFFLPRGVHGK